ncbi:Ubiquinone/menaquinone biosynthesis C-methylase UbiE [Aliiroseovarius sediminilitoris]|uniref:Ubiquinone/menaquinone biosynthesis C-methylase UbiE n=1 Tax=Aliiroseovarius sediminilitoris TaxID=1173584 RepID=A0A1I0NEK4_9RHOB|nr:methyltransferase domain-containing protein [Aliiroseovarius sediminilitoris]SEV99553.1 Ubiquinone/menaquinone biosynthesis C-methylase UbiE [Aliiroseovarius sediminilitoris]
MILNQTPNDTVVPGPPAYERYFVSAIGQPIAEDLIAAAQLQPGEQVLDVACGTGIVARLAARHVAPTGTVTGADINPGMIAEAKRACEDFPNIDWHEADAAALPMPDDSFDVVLCQMGLQFFPAKLPTLKEMRRVLRPGGRVLVNTPGPMPALFSVIRDAVSRYVGPKSAGFLDAVFSVHDPDEYTELLRSAGFRHMNVRRAEKALELPPPGDFLWQYLQSTPIGADVFNKTDADERATLEAHVRKGCRQFETGSGMKLQVGLTTAAARK